MNQADLVERLATKFAPPEWAFFTEVTLGRRRADAVAVNLWRSRGHRVVGFEVKCSRSDWCRELRDPAKMERTFQECDRIFLVVSDRDIVRNDLPAGWGLMAPHGRGLRIHTKAEDTGAANTREFWARLLAKLVVDRDKEILAEAHRVAERMEKNDPAAKRFQREVEALKEDVKLFRDREIAAEKRLNELAASIDWVDGLPIWERQRFVEVLTVLRETGWWRNPDMAKQVRQAARGLHRQLAQVVNQLDGLARAMESPEPAEAEDAGAAGRKAP